MMPTVLGICPSQRLSRKNPFGSNVYVWVVTPLPAGTYSLALISDSTVHLPTKYSNLLCSGPGFGPFGGACASESAVDPQIRMAATDDRMLIFFLRKRDQVSRSRRSLLSMNVRTPSVTCP